MGLTVAADDHGVAHCFRCGYVETRRHERDLTPIERAAFARRMDAMRRQHDTEQRQRQAEAAAAALVRWTDAVPAQEHPYLSAKGVRAHGVRIEPNHTLLIPMRDSEGRLHSLQTIAPDGTKRFMPGGKVKGCYHAIGRPSGKLAICEGYATGATLHEETGHAVAVAQALRAKYPCLTLVLCADDDWKTEGNPGLMAATGAACAVGGLLAVPKFDGFPRGDKDTDFNDLHRLAGTAVTA
ncbi:MAG: hypothetical protein EOO29_56440 [Comamonadaceae bacterium]|nr:MAG: hypothetical protein EOO29_56440 [Comamonadaceae bacterium]